MNKYEALLDEACDKGLIVKEKPLQYNNGRIKGNRIRDAIHNLPSGDVKKLQGRDGYRLRVGDYRIIFDKYGNIIYIERIGNRGQIYKEG